MHFSGQTTHRVFNKDCRDLSPLNDASIDLVITSPPYPMVEMWDEVFGSLSQAIKHHLQDKEPLKAFEAMHELLAEVWGECFRVLKPGGHLIINIGDATRSMGEFFKLYPNHAAILQSCERLGFFSLPLIVWQKTVNAPNKFMGSGTLPVGAYVTLEHEFILIFRKPPARVYDAQHKNLRNESALFWEERNQWYLDRWNVPGVRQGLSSQSLRGRSAAFNLEIPFRLIHMFSLLGDMVLDPFVGTGTTSLAALASGRSSIGFELDKGLFSPGHLAELDLLKLRQFESGRLASHLSFAKEYSAKKGPDFGYRNEVLQTRVVTRPESSIRLYEPQNARVLGSELIVDYTPITGKLP